MAELRSLVDDHILDPQPPPPDGGLKAWLQVMGCFFCWFNSWGLTNAFGVFQTYYEFNHLQGNTPSQISWIGSLQSFLLIAIGILTGPAFDGGYCYVLLWSGSFLVVFGYIMTSISTEYWQVMLAQGVVIGIGSGCMFIPSIAILPQYFTTRRALANGVAASGSGFGGIIYPIVVRQLIPQIGFAWTVRVVALLALTTSGVALAVLRVRIKAAKKRVLFDLSALRELAFLTYTLSLAFALIALYIPTFYIQSFATRKGIADQRLADFILPILNTGSLIGRIVPNFFADKTGPLNILIPFMILSSVMTFAWIGVTNTGGLIVFALLYGFASGAILSLPPSILTTLSPTLGVVGTRMGTSFLIASLGLLIGTPVSGAILGDSGSFTGLQAFAGVALMVAAMLSIVSRYFKAGAALMTKA